nr:integrase, catalytic region, zinc finger, CCHC-type, peptidase aspartic, catalytic [Tanacetum cinerariifolium]
MRVQTIDKTTSLQNKIENLKTQLKGKMPCVTSNDATPKVPACAKYAINVQLIPPRQRYNRVVYHGYLKHLRDTLDTLCEIVKEARSKRPSENNLDYACVYTKRSQELFENVSASCLKVNNKGDTIIATTHATRKKHVTFADPLETSGNNPPKIVKQQTMQKTNILIPYSTGVSNATKAKRSQPESNTMHDRTSPANSVPEKKVEDHHRKNKSKLSKKNRVDSSTSVRRTILDTNSNSLCKTCIECISFVNHDKCVDNFLKSSKTSPVVQIVLWYLDSGCSKHMTGDRSRLKNFVKKFIGTVTFRNNHFGAIMGYGDYVLGDSVISRVYYVEGLGHNLFSVGQFYDSDLEVAFRKHTCFVRDLDGVNLIKDTSKNKSWLWHRRLNHLNFGTINDLAWKDLFRGIPRLKSEKDHLCSACQLGKSEKATQQPNTINTIMEVLHTLHMDLCEPLRKLDLSFLRVFGALCYPTNDSEDLGKLKAKADIDLFVCYAPNRKGYRIYNKRTRQIMETIHVTFDELTGETVPVQTSSGLAPNLLTPGPISLGLIPNHAPAIPYVPHNKKELESLFQSMFDDYFKPSTIDQQVPLAPAVHIPINPPCPLVSISVDQDAPS